MTGTLIPATGSATYPLAVKQGTLSMDESVSPFIGGDITIAHPGLAVFALIDNKAKVRLNVVSGGTTLNVTLNVEARQLITETGEIGINLVNDEALVEDVSPTTNVDYNDSQGSVRTIVNSVLTRALGKTTTASYASGADRAFPTFREVRNYFPNPSFEISSGLMTAVNAALSQSTTYKNTGTYSLKVTPNSTSTGSYAYAYVPLEPGKTYTAWCYARIVTPQTGTLNGDARKLQFLATVSGQQSIYNRSNAAANTTSTTTRLSMTFTVPPAATDTAIRFISGGTNTADNSVYFDAVQIIEGDGNDTNGALMAFWDGDTADSATYNYAWDDTAGLSSSTRTPVLDRDEGALVWEPGTGGMRFLKDILEATGLRLFQDIDGAWKLADNSYRVAGQARIGYGFNLYGATDLMSRTATQLDGMPLFCDAVVLRYAWTDVLGRERTASDIAGPANPTKAYTPDVIEAPYPGPGRAAYMLSRLKLRQRQLQVTGATDFTIRPGQGAVITTVDSGVQTGYVDAVSWDLGNDEMTVYTKGLIGVQDGSIGKSPTGQTIGSVAGSIAAYTN
ncbi:carbohydrate binding domain-containing protein [Curtobacterium sp. MCBA15_008]|uniref:carbohydrate binding domain-containing protein n=1 Tax=Curtobacterium sp. MCBA15_008 TaxID=1898736 RepID=UPI0011145957|nr:carbohydrate binding domain-containing protein [Curtobacterium sp. MCBA15_008]